MTKCYFLSSQISLLKQWHSLKNIKNNIDRQAATNDENQLLFHVAYQKIIWIWNWNERIIEISQFSMCRYHCQHKHTHLELFTYCFPCKLFFCSSRANENHNGTKIFHYIWLSFRASIRIPLRKIGLFPISFVIFIIFVFSLWYILYLPCGLLCFNFPQWRIIYSAVLSKKKRRTKQTSDIRLILLKCSEKSYLPFHLQ